MSNTPSKNKLITIIGPTASGKTGLAVKLAREFGGEVVSADSRQVYRGMDIGTGKDLDEYASGGEKIPYHLIDVADPKEYFDLSKYQKMAFEAINDICDRGRTPILAGGSGLYLQAVVDGYILSGAEPDKKKRLEREQMTAKELFAKLSRLNPKLANGLNNSDQHNPRRLVRYLEIAEQTGLDSLPDKTEETPYDVLVMEISVDPEVLEQKIYKRLHERLDNENMIGEVQRLNAEGVSWQKLEKLGLEYKWIAYYLENMIDYDELTEKLYRDICKYAKRQLTWFKRWEKQGRKIHKIENYEQAEQITKRFLEKEMYI